MPKKESTVLYRWFDEVWNKGNENAIYEMLDDNAITHGITGDVSRGPDAFKVFYDGFRLEFPKINIDIEQTVSEDDFEVVRCNVDATNRDGAKVNFTGMCMAKTRDGKILEGWNNFDFLTMYKQLGQTLTNVK